MTEREIMPTFSSWLETEKEELKSKNLSSFSEAVTEKIQCAVNVILKRTGLDDLAKLGDQLQVETQGMIVASLNLVLPEDYPYIIALIAFEDEIGFSFIALYRKDLPG